MDAQANRSASYHAPNHVDDTRYDIDPYTETTVASPHHEGYFDNPEMAYASMSPLTLILFLQELTTRRSRDASHWSIRKQVRSITPIPSFARPDALPTPLTRHV